MLTWFLEVFKEEQSGAHTIEIQKGFQYAILLFILSELMLFFSFFWAYFHYTLNANSFTGGSYNAKGVVAFYWYRIPLLNTLLLLSSGLSLTIGHILLISNDKTLKLKIWYNILVMLEVLNIANDSVINIGSSKINFNPINDMVSFLNKIIKNFKIKSNFFKKVTTTISNVIENKYFNTIDNNLSEMVVFRINSDRTLLVLPTIYTLNLKKDRNLVFNTCTFWIMDTVLKGFVFLMYQAYEYTSSMFSITDSIYSSVFYSLTGLHGIHVFVGVTFLFVFVLVTTQTKRYTTSNEKTIKIINWTSYKLNYFSHRIAFEGSAWYWHFVDVVWFFVFVFVYWWGFSA